MVKTTACMTMVARDLLWRFALAAALVLLAMGVAKADVDKPRIGLDRAIDIAMAALPGELVTTEYETSFDCHEVKIRTADGVMEVYVSAETGEVLFMENEMHENEADDWR